MNQSIQASLQSLRSSFQSGTSRRYKSRIALLHQLRDSLMRHEEPVYDALWKDLRKNKEETWVTELGFVISELNATIKHLHHWMQPEKAATNLLNIPSKSYIHSEPLGAVLIIGPWNYPLQLLFTPLVGALAAGNHVVLKPSEFAPATSAVMKTIIEETFAPEQVLFVEGDGATVVPELMNNFRFDHVFYTGSTFVGKLVYQMAASKLVPVTLELGGKSPCVIEADANLKVAARRIAVTKFSNAGQMCVAPDYILIHEKVKEPFVRIFKSVIKEFFSEQPEINYNYGRIVNEKQFDRIAQYLQQGTILYGGKTDRSQLFIAPTIIESAPLTAAVMQDEIFGPVVPIISFREKEEALQIIRQHPDPLAFYVFTESPRNEQWWLDAVPAGGACINNASWHLTNHNLPFGGRGNSGIGRYHGKFSFDTFSHKKAVLKTPTWFDPSVKYPPFKGKLGLFRKVIR